MEQMTGLGLVTRAHEVGGAWERLAGFCPILGGIMRKQKVRSVIPRGRDHWDFDGCVGVHRNGHPGARVEGALGNDSPQVQSPARREQPGSEEMSWGEALRRERWTLLGWEGGAV